LAQALLIFLGKEHLLKNWLISTLDKVITFKGAIFEASTKPLFTSQNRVEISCKNLSLFSNTLLLGFLWFSSVVEKLFSPCAELVRNCFGGEKTS
jgi:hypothetical protein